MAGSAVKFTGQGTKLIPTADCYEGEISENGKRNGQGVYKFPNNCFQYHGTYVEGQKEGHGRLELSDGSFFEGQFVGGEIVGNGKRVWKDGSVLKCQFVLGEAEGQGELQSAKGGWTYRGNFKNNRPHGIGVREDTSGGTYGGEFCNGLFHGHGQMRSLDGYLYEGGWQHGKRHGMAKEVLPSGQQFEGQFADDTYHGIGSMTTADGRSYCGVGFVCGELEHSALQMQLEYPKTVNKKNVELPVPIEIGSVVPAEFTVSVRVLCQAQQHPDATEGDQPASVDSDLQTMAAESGRTVQLHLQQGHEDPDGSVQPLEHPVFKPRPRTPQEGTTPPEGTTEQEGNEAAEAPTGLHSLCAVTVAGECSFQVFQIGGEGLADVEPGPYTLLFRSRDLEDGRILVQLSQPKGKKK